MGCIKVLHKEKISNDCIPTAVLLAPVGSFRKKAMSPEMSTNLACKYNAECARLILKGGHGSKKRGGHRMTTSLVDAKDQLTLELLHVVARTHSARYNDPDNAFQGMHLSILVSPVSKRVGVISSLDKSTGDLLSYLPDHQATMLLTEKTRESWEEASTDAQEGCVTASVMLVVVEVKISAQAVEGMNKKRSIEDPLSRDAIDAALSIEDPLSRDGRGNPLFCKVQILSQHRVGSGGDHNIERSLCPLLWVAKDCVAVKDGSVHCVKLLLCFETDMEVQDLRKHGPIHMAAFQDMFSNLNSRSMVPWDISSLQENQVMSDESAIRLLNDEFDYNKSYTGVEISACHWPFVPRKCSSEMAKSQCALKQDSKFVPQKHDHYNGNILVRCLAPTVDSEYLTACFNAELGYVEKSLANELKRGSEMKTQGFGILEFEIEKGTVDAKDHLPGKTVDIKDAFARASLLPLPNWIPLAKPFSCDLTELPESALDHQYPLYPPTASTTEVSHHIESQQVDPCSKGNVQSQMGSNCSRIHTERVPIFVREISGKVLTFTVILDEASEHLMCLYEEKTKMKMKLSYQYFSYEGKTIYPEQTLLFYGVGRNSTVHACGRLLGGMPTTLASYVQDNRNKFLKEVTLPNGKVSLKITKKGCRLLSTWLNCFTTAFSMGKSWNGEFTLDDFKHVDGHIRIIKKPRIYPAGSMGKDLTKLVIHIEDIFHSNKKHLISMYPPYLKNFTRFINNMTIGSVLSAEDKLILETHVCYMTSCDRETLVISLYRRYEGLDENEMIKWDDAIKRGTCPVPWSTALSELEAFGDGRSYPASRFGAFKLIKDMAVHATDNRNESEEESQNVDGIELMIPACEGDFLPSIIINLIEKKVDISAELLAAKIKCFCKKCDSADASDSSDSQD